MNEKFKYTTAYDVVYEAFIEAATQKKSYIGLQGSQGAGKTWNVLAILMGLALEFPGLVITIAGAEHSKMMKTIIKDFKMLAKMMGTYKRLGIKASGDCEVENDSQIFFIGLLDKADYGKGNRNDYLFVNEADRIPFENFTEIESRSDFTIIDFNPSRRFWYHDQIMPYENDCVHRVMTFEMNEALKEPERRKILRYKEKGYDEHGNVISEFWANRWQVMGLGQLGSPEGRIFYWQSVSYQEFLKFEGVEVYAVDWGMVDPWAIVLGKYRDGKLMLHELNYESENELWMRLSEAKKHQIKGHGEEGLVTWMFMQLGVPLDSTIVCDTNRADKIVQLRRSGWEGAVGAKKRPGSLLGRITNLRNLEVYYTVDSKNLQYEQEHYVWEKDRYGIQLEKPVDKDNHTMDCAGYIEQYLEDEGYIETM